MRFAVGTSIIITLLFVDCGGTSAPAGKSPAVPSETAVQEVRTPSSSATSVVSPPPVTPGTATPAPPSATETLPPAVQTGIAGTVSIGPTCPVQRVDSPCPDRPYEATITVWKGATKIAETHSNVDGRFLVELAAGTYRVVGESPGTFPRGTEQMVTVQAGGVTMVQIQYDSGIR